ncbi:MAG: CDGSH iron-sulfur domain-containing protein [Bacteroidales bacterium]|nr:CDGSH iron-sulfur domain-containing protein [Bacteroidales bacterium]
MKTMEVTIIDKGPIVLIGDFELIDQHGEKRQLGNKVYLCRCGDSKNKPLCDGSHKKKWGEIKLADNSKKKKIIQTSVF